MQSHRSLFSLVMFCATSTLVAGLGLAVLFGSITVAFAVGRTLGSPDLEVMASVPEPAAADTHETFHTALYSGVITDDRCGAKHDMGSDKTSAECTRACVRDGVSYALVNGNTKYKLIGNTDELARAAGQRVSVEGVLTGDTVKATSVTIE